MKKINAAIVLSMIFAVMMMGLCGCGKTQEDSPGADVSAAPSSFEYTIDRVDKSLVSEETNVKLTQFYDLVVVSGGDERVSTNLNDGIKEGYTDFLEGLSDTEEYFNDLVQASRNGGGGQEYINTVESAVSADTEKIFSIEYKTEWFMGGVSNSDTYGEVFSKETGSRLSLDKYLGVDARTAKGYVLQTVAGEIAAEPDRYMDDAYDTVEDMPIEKISYYVEGSNVFICFRTYEITFGAGGCAVMELDVSGNGKVYADDTDDIDDVDDIDIFDEPDTFVEAGDRFIHSSDVKGTEIKFGGGNSFVMTVNLLEGYGTVSGTYTCEDNGTTGTVRLNVKNRDFSGFGGDDITEMVMVYNPESDVLILKSHNGADQSQVMGDINPGDSFREAD